MTVSRHWIWLACHITSKEHACNCISTWCSCFSKLGALCIAIVELVNGIKPFFRVFCVIFPTSITLRKKIWKCLNKKLDSCFSPCVLYVVVPQGPCAQVPTCVGAQPGSLCCPLWSTYRQRRRRRINEVNSDYVNNNGQTMVEKCWPCKSLSFPLLTLPWIDQNNRKQLTVCWQTIGKMTKDNRFLISSGEFYDGLYRRWTLGEIGDNAQEYLHTKTIWKMQLSTQILRYAWQKNTWLLSHNVNTLWKVWYVMKEWWKTKQFTNIKYRIANYPQQLKPGKCSELKSLTKTGKNSMKFWDKSKSFHGIKFNIPLKGLLLIIDCILRATKVTLNMLTKEMEYSDNAVYWFVILFDRIATETNHHYETVAERITRKDLSVARKYLSNTHRDAQILWQASSTFHCSQLRKVTVFFKDWLYPIGVIYPLP